LAELLVSKEVARMFIVLVSIRVKSDCVEAFKKASLDNVSNSIKEPGVARFDFLEQVDDPTRFSLIEVYRTPADFDKHKETAHYARWRDAVADMMAEPRVGVKYMNVYPGDDGWAS